MLTRYADIVPVVPYGVTVAAGTPAASGAYRYQFVCVSNRHRVRQKGTIVKVRMWIGTLTNVTNFRVQVWRPNKTNLFYEVGISENFIGTVTPNSINTITLTSPIENVQQGDYIGALIESSAVMTNMIGAVVVTGTTTYKLTDFGAKYGSFDWLGGSTANANTSVPIECSMQAPDIVCIGDSIDEAWSYHTTEADTVSTGGGYNPHATYMTRLAELFRERFGYDLTWQNVAIGGQTSTQIQARFAADVLALYPRVIICGMGNNDINGSVPEATFLANYQLVADACENNVSGPDPRPAALIARLMPPHTGWSVAQHQAKDLWHADLIAQLAANNPSAQTVNVASRTGQARAGGDAGNLWDIQPRYLSGDGMAHQNPLGLSQFAYALMPALVLAELALGTPKRQQVLTAVAALLGTITVANGFRTDLGLHVDEWDVTPLDPAVETLRIEYRDEAGGTGYEGVGEHLHTLPVTFRILCQANDGTAKSTLRNALADLYEAIYADVTFGGLAQDTNQQGEVRLSYGEAADRAAGAELDYLIEYTTAPGSP